MVSQPSFIKNYNVITDKFPIMSMQFQNIPEDMVQETFDEKKFTRKDYKQLYIAPERIELLPEQRPNSFKKFHNQLLPLIKFITITLLKTDNIRYPIFEDVSRWFDRKIGDKSYQFIPVIDKPGYSMPWHLDNRLVLISGVINMQDNCTATIFRDHNRDLDISSDQPDLVYLSSTTKYTGTAWLNTEMTWHAVPVVSSLRKILLFNVYL